MTGSSQRFQRSQRRPSGFTLVELYGRNRGDGHRDWWSGDAFRALGSDVEFQPQALGGADGGARGTDANIRAIFLKLGPGFH